MHKLEQIKSQFERLHNKIQNDLEEKYPHSDIRLIWDKHSSFKEWKKLHDEIFKLDQNYIYDFLNL